MRRSLEKYADHENEAHEEPNAKKNRWDNKQSNIVTLDNGTMVEMFKFLNYCQLAKKSLVSKRFSDLIQTHRHKLALLYVHTVCMQSFRMDPNAINIFDTELSAEAYKEWVIRNNYSKQVLLEHQDANTQNILNGIKLSAYYKEFTVLFACVKNLNHETWPLFQHFVRLLSDPFIRIRWMALIPQNDVFNFLTAAIDLDRGRANRDKQLLDFFVTGFGCASEMVVTGSRISKAIVVDLVQKFVDLESYAECHIVHSIRGNVIRSTAEALKNNYSKFYIKEDKDRYGRTARVFEIVNANIGKKMRLSVSASRQVALEIINL